MFVSTGNVYEKKERVKSARWPKEVYIDVRAYISDHPTFYLEELKETTKGTFSRKSFHAAFLKVVVICIQSLTAYGTNCKKICIYSEL